MKIGHCYLACCLRLLNWVQCPKWAKAEVCVWDADLTYDAHQNTRLVVVYVNTLAASWPRKPAIWSHSLPESTHPSYNTLTTTVKSALHNFPRAQGVIFKLFVSSVSYLPEIPHHIKAGKSTFSKEKKRTTHIWEARSRKYFEFLLKITEMPDSTSDCHVGHQSLQPFCKLFFVLTVTTIFPLTLF